MNIPLRNPDLEQMENTHAQHRANVNALDNERRAQVFNTPLNDADKEAYEAWQAEATAGGLYEENNPADYDSVGHFYRSQKAKDEGRAEENPFAFDEQFAKPTNPRYNPEVGEWSEARLREKADEANATIEAAKARAEEQMEQWKRLSPGQRELVTLYADATKLVAQEGETFTRWGLLPQEEREMRYRALANRMAKLFVGNDAYVPSKDFAEWNGWQPMADGQAMVQRMVEVMSSGGQVLESDLAKEYRARLEQADPNDPKAAEAIATQLMHERGYFDWTREGKSTWDKLGSIVKNIPTFMPTVAGSPAAGTLTKQDFQRSSNEVVKGQAADVAEAKQKFNTDLMRSEAILQWMQIAPSLTDNANSIIARAINAGGADQLDTGWAIPRILGAYHHMGGEIQDFFFLNEEEQEKVAGLLGVMRGKREASLANWAQDLGLGIKDRSLEILFALPGMLSKTSRNAMIDRAFGDGTADAWMRAEQRLYNATADIEVDYGFVGNGLKGALEQMPVWATLALGGMSGAAVKSGALLKGGTKLGQLAATHGAQVALTTWYANMARDEFVRQGGSWEAGTVIGLVVGLAQSLIETQQANQLWGSNLTERQAQTAFVRAAKLLVADSTKGKWKRVFSKEGAGVAKDLLATWALETGQETFEEGLQKFAESFGIELGLSADVVKALKKAAKDGVKEMYDTASTMGWSTLLGSGRRASREIGRHYAMNERVAADGAWVQFLKANAVDISVEDVRKAWNEAGSEEARMQVLRDAGLDNDGAGILNRVFEARERQLRRYKDDARHFLGGLALGGNNAVTLDEQTLGVLSDVLGLRNVSIEVSEGKAVLSFDGATTEDGKTARERMEFSTADLQNSIVTDASRNMAESVYQALDTSNTLPMVDGKRITRDAFIQQWTTDEAFRTDAGKDLVRRGYHVGGSVVLDANRATIFTALHEVFHYLEERAVASGAISREELKEVTKDFRDKDGNLDSEAIADYFAGQYDWFEANRKTNRTGVGEYDRAHLAILQSRVDEAKTEEERKAAMDALTAASKEAGRRASDLKKEVERDRAEGDRQLTRIRQRDERIAEAQQRAGMAVTRQEKGVLGQIKLAFQGLADAFLGYRYAQPHEAIDDFAKTLFNYPVRALARVAEEAKAMAQMRHSIVASPNDVQISVNDNAEGVDDLRYSGVGSQEYAILRSAIYERDRQFQSIHRIKPLNWGFAYTADNVYLYNRKDYGEFDIIYGWHLNDEISAEIDEVRRLFNEEIKQKRGKRTPKIANGWDALSWVRRAVNRYNSLTHDDGRPIKRNGRMDDLARGDFQAVSYNGDVPKSNDGGLKTLPSTERSSIAADSAQREHDEVVARHKGNDQWMRAPNGKPTNLTERQWVQVRTPSFKRWFGDWEALAELAGSTLDEAKAFLKSLMKAHREIRTSDGALLRMVSQSAKAFSKEAETQSSNKEAHWCALRNIESIIGRARFLYEEAPRNGSTDIQAYVKYGAIFTFKGEQYLAKITSKKYPTIETQNFYNVESVNVQKIVDRGIHEAIGKGQPLDAIDIDNITKLLFDSNPSSVSNVVDENGEPLVVYRGAPYDPLAQEAGKGIIAPERYFTPDEQYAKRYEKGDGVTRAYFVNIRNPFDVRNERDAQRMLELRGGHDFHTGISGALDWAEAPDAEEVNDLWEGEYDGLILDEGGDLSENGPIHRGISYVPFNGGAQVKSATDNIGTFDEANPDIRYSISGIYTGAAADYAQREYDDVVAQYKGTEQWLKAPNGKPTNLTERQWVQVRTPSFKKWFGDWENDPENASKVVDENGEPLVVYHGTESGGFTEFIDTDDIGYFFTSSFDMARSYSGERGVYAPSRISTWDEALKEAETFGTAMIEGYAVENVNGRMVADSFYPSKDEVEANLTLNKGDKVVKAYRIDDGYDEGDVFLEKDLNEFVDTYARPQDAGLNYEVFLNLKDPLIVNGNGSNWDNVIDHIGTMVTYDELTDEQKERIAEEMGVDVDELEDYQVEDLPVFDIDNFDVRTPQRTRDWVSEAADMGCDGVIFKDIYDEGKFGYGTLSADVFVAMRANQIKSTENVAPTENDDIRYSIVSLPNGRLYVNIDVDQHLFDGKPLEEYPKIARKIIQKRFRGKVIGIKPDNAFVNKEGEEEFAYPAKHLAVESDEYNAKLRLAPELDNAMLVGKFIKHEDDHDNRHKDAVGGWNSYETVFRFGDMFFSGEINVKLTKRGRVFYGLTQIKNITESISGAYGKLPLPTSFSDTSTIPHSGADVNENRFSVSARRPDLVGLHNMSADGLKGADDLGGFAMPSIAITRDSMGHNEFGDISLLMRTSAFNPQVNRLNKIYSRDAWTPTFPGIINKVDAARMVSVSERLLDTLPADLRKAYTHGDTYSLLDEDGVNDAFKTVNTAGEYYRHNAALKAAYLVAKGETLQPVMKPKSFLGRSRGRILALGEEGLRIINESIGDLLVAFHSVPGAERDAWIEQHRGEIEAAFIDAAYASRVAKNPAVAEYSKEEIYGDLFTKNPLGFADVIDLANAVSALRKAMANGEADAQIVDEYATKRAVNDRVSSDDAAFIAWLDEQYGNPVLARGIRNNKDFYTPSGGRRSWDALHDPVTLSNVVKNMLSKQREQGEGFLGANPFGLAAAKLNSFKDVIKNEDLLKELPKEEMDAIRDEFIAAFHEISARYLNTWQYTDDNPFTASSLSNEALLDAWAASKGSFAGLKRELNGYGRRASDDLIRDLQEVMNGIAKFPTKYFEAKPMRAVGFEEVAAAIIPDTTTEETREILKRRGVPVYEYTAGNDTSRLAALNMAADDVKGTRFSVVLGERGAANLNANLNAMNNLSVAKQMLGDDDWTTISKEQKQKIKRATGWEKGADGKWRYEWLDFKVRDIEDDRRTIVSKMTSAERRKFNDYMWNIDTLSDKRRANFKAMREKYGYKLNDELTLADILYGNGANGLFNAYPQLRDMRVRFKRIVGDVYGWYNDETNEIVLKEDYLWSWMNDALRKTLTHEVQHAIQHIEGFALGGHPIMGHANELADQYNTLVERANAGEEIPQTEIDASYKRYVEARNKAYDDYHRLAGEVESRNAESRRYLNFKDYPTPLLLEDTEDVARDQQIVKEIESAVAKLVSYEQHTASHARLAKAEKRSARAAKSLVDKAAKTLNDVRHSIAVDNTFAHPRAAALEVEHTNALLEARTAAILVAAYSEARNEDVSVADVKDILDGLGYSTVSPMVIAKKVNAARKNQDRERGQAFVKMASDAIAEEPLEAYGQAIKNVVQKAVEKDATNKALTRELEMATGVLPVEFTADNGFSVATSLLLIADDESKMTEEQIAARAAKRQQWREKREQLQRLAAEGDTEAIAELDAMEQGEPVSEEIIDEARMAAFAERQRAIREAAKELRKELDERDTARKPKPKRSANATEEPKPTETTEEDEDNDISDEMLAKALRDKGLAFADVRDLLTYIVQDITARYIAENPDVTLDALKTKQVYLHELRKTLKAHILTASRELTYGLAREQIREEANKVTDRKTFAGILASSEHALTRMQSLRVKQSRKSIIADMVKIIDEALGKRPISATTAIQKRKLSGDEEMRLAYVRRVLKMGDTAVRRELERVNQVLAANNVSDSDTLKDTDERDVATAIMQRDVLNVYAGAKHMMPAQLEEMFEFLRDELNGAREAFEKEQAKIAAKIKEMKDWLALAIVQGEPDVIRDKDLVGKGIDSIMGLFRLRLEALLDRARGPVREKALEAIDEIDHLMAKAADDLTSQEMDNRKAVAELYKQCYGSATAAKERLNEELPEEVRAKLSKYKTSMTRDHALYLYAYISQNDYNTNAAKYGRLDGDYVKTLLSVLDKRDLTFLKGMQKILHDQFPALQSEYRKMTGSTVFTTPNYFPVKPRLVKDEDATVGVAESRSWAPIISELTPRVRHGYDTEEIRATEIFFDRLNKYARMMAYGNAGYIVNSVLLSGSVTNAIEAAWGKGETANLRKVLLDTFAGVQLPSDPLSNIVNWTTRAAAVGQLAYNLQSAFVQLAAGWIASGHELGIGNVLKNQWQVMFGLRGGEDVQRALRILQSSNWYKARYGGGLDIHAREAMSMSNSSLFLRLYQAGMKPIQVADWWTSMNNAVAIYLKAEKDYLDKGFSPEEAQARAISAAGSHIERTQQSGRTQDQTNLIRRIPLARMFMMFASAPLQLAQYEIRAFQQLSRGVPGASNKVVNSMLINHVLIPALIALARAAWKALTQGDDDDETEEEERKRKAEWAISFGVECALGQYNAVPLLGSATSALANLILGGEHFAQQWSLANMSFASRVAKEGSDSVKALVEHFVNDPYAKPSWDEVIKEFNDFLRINPAWRTADNVAEKYSDKQLLEMLGADIDSDKIRKAKAKRTRERKKRER